METDHRGNTKQYPKNGNTKRYLPMLDSYLTRRRRAVVLPANIGPMITCTSPPESSCWGFMPALCAGSGTETRCLNAPDISCSQMMYVIAINVNAWICVGNGEFDLGLYRPWNAMETCRGSVAVLKFGGKIDLRNVAFWLFFEIWKEGRWRRRRKMRIRLFFGLHSLAQFWNGLNMTNSWYKNYIKYSYGVAQ